MAGDFINHIKYRSADESKLKSNFRFLKTDFGKIRMYVKGNGEKTIINAPDGPNVIEHQLPLLERLSTNFKVVCFEFPGLGLSYPSRKFDYSFDHGAKLLLQVIEKLGLDTCSALFSCSNGFYALRAAEIAPNKFEHLFISQTPSIKSMQEWSKINIPKVLTYPIIGQVANEVLNQKMADVWYKLALPKKSELRSGFHERASNSLKNGGCYCLSSLVQGISKHFDQEIKSEVPSTLVYGGIDYTHRNTDFNTFKIHSANAKLIEFEKCGHFPELEKTEEYAQIVINTLYKG